jgi:hypothetical protein
MRQVFSADAVYDLPFGLDRRWLSQPGPVNAVLRRWSLTSIGVSRSGLPANVTENCSRSSVATGYTTSQRPNLVPGVSLTPLGGKQTGM